MLQPIDIIKALNNMDENGENMTSVMFSIDIWDPETCEHMRSDNEFPTRTPKVTIARNGGFVTFIFTYPDNTNAELGDLWSLFQYYQHETAEMDEFSIELPVMKISIVPTNLDGKYCIIGVNPIRWWLQPDRPEKIECNTIQIMFDSRNIGFYHSPSVDLRAIIAETAAEIASENAMIEFYESEEAKRQAYTDEANDEIREEFDQEISNRFNPYNKIRNDS